jgi:hypothetical protein
MQVWADFTALLRPDPERDKSEIDISNFTQDVSSGIFLESP